MSNKTYRVLKRKNLLESWQWKKIRNVLSLVVIFPLIFEFLGYISYMVSISYNLNAKEVAFFWRCIETVSDCFNYFIATEVWQDVVSNMALYIWSGQITASLIIFTLLALISNKMDERILGIRIGTWLFKYNLYLFNLWECIVLIGLLNIISLLMLVIKNNFLIITNFMCVGALILFCCYFIFLVFYKRSRIYYMISLAINPEEYKYNKGFSENKIIKKLDGKKLVASNMKNEITCGNKTLVYEGSYHREEIIILASIYFKLANSKKNVVYNKEILVKAISQILCSSGKHFSDIFIIEGEHCDLYDIISEYNLEYRELIENLNKYNSNP